jgi:hypothetical protein
MFRLIIILAIINSLVIRSQANLKDSCIGLTSVGMQYSANFPGGDMVKDYGFINGIGLDVFHKFKTNWSVGLDAQYLFGSKLKHDNPFGDYLTDNSSIITNNGTIGDIRINSAGWNIAISAGKIFNWIGPNKNSGIQFRFGLGVLSYKIFIDPRNALIPQFVQPYKKGYDQLHLGVLAKQSIGYVHYGSKYHWLNFSTTLEISESYSTNIRGYNYAQAKYDTSWMMDFLYSIKIAYILPVYKKATSNKFR